MNKKTKTIIWVIVAVVLVAVLGILFAEIISPRYVEISFSEFNQKVLEGKINQAFFDGYQYKGQFVDEAGKVTGFFLA